ncbi:MAG: hypothetical protein ABI051_13910 [Vicinamibacterales bacterium]
MMAVRALALILRVATLTAEAAAQTLPPPREEYEVKAAYIFNLVNASEWPPSVLNGPADLRAPRHRDHPFHGS